MCNIEAAHAFCLWVGYNKHIIELGVFFPPHGAGTDMLASHAMDTAQIAGHEEHGACRIVDMQLTIVKWTLLQRNFFWTTGVGEIKL